MRKRVLGAPRWVRALLYGVPFGVVMGVYYAMTMNNLTFAGDIYVGLVCGLLSGVCFGLFMEWSTKRHYDSVRAAVGVVPDAQQRIAINSALRGPAPADRMVRLAALRLAVNTRERSNRLWRFNTAVYTFVILAFVALALTTSPWWWLGVALFAGLLTLHLTSRRRMDRRIAVLSEGPPTDA